MWLNTPVNAYSFSIIDIEWDHEHNPINISHSSGKKKAKKITIEFNKGVHCILCDVNQSNVSISVWFVVFFFIYKFSIVKFHVHVFLSFQLRMYLLFTFIHRLFPIFMKINNKKNDKNKESMRWIYWRYRMKNVSWISSKWNKKINFLTIFLFV